MSTSSRRLEPHQTNTVDAVTVYLEQLMLSQDPTSTGATVAVRKPKTLANQSFPDIDYFRTETEPAIALRSYVERTVAYMRCSPECFIFALVYLRRAVDAGFPLSRRTVHRVYMTALTIAAKVRDDLYYSMSYYGQIGGVSAKDLGRMELHFLLAVINFEAEVSMPEYTNVCADIGRAITASKRLTQLTPIAPLPFTSRKIIATVGSEAGLSSCVGTPTSSPSIQSLSVSRRDSPIHLGREDMMVDLQHVLETCTNWTVDCNMFCPLLA